MERTSPLTARVRPRLRTAFRRSGERTFAGFAVDAGDMDRRFAVEILADGLPVRLVRSDLYQRELSDAGLGDGCYGFSLSFPEGDMPYGAVVEARLANIGTALGAPLLLGAGRVAVRRGSIGEVRWHGGLRVTGWIVDSDGDAAVGVLIDGVPVLRARCAAWRHVSTGLGDAPARAFDVDLPERFADGAVHQCAIVNDRGKALDGCPFAFLAFADGLRAAVTGTGVSERDRLRADLFDRLVPMSLPFSDYETWRERLPVECTEAAGLRVAVVMVGPGPAGDTLDSLQAQTHADWVAVSLPPTAGPTSFDAARARAFLDDASAGCDVVVFALAGSVLEPPALERIAAAFAQFEDAEAVYADLDIEGDSGSLWPLALPAFDYERMLEQGYCAHLFALSRAAAERSLAVDAGDLYRVFNALFDDGAPPTVVHLPRPLATLPAFDTRAASEALAEASLAHLRRRDVRAAAAPAPGEPGLLPAVRIARASGNPSTTIVIPTRNRHDLLRGCIESILPAVARRGAEILILDNDSSDPDALDYLADVEGRHARVLRIPGEFNFARLNNRGAEAARGNVLCLLNNDIEALDADWLDDMLGRIVEPDVGAVGALLLSPSRVVQHGGLVLGPKFEAAHAFTDRIDGDPGYGDLLRVAHECSAVTAACLVTRRQDYHEAGGMDEVRFPINFNDLDYCLKLRAMGRRIVFTPHARLVHLESASRGSDDEPQRRRRFEREVRNLRAKWGRVLAADPYYSPILALDPTPFSALACPARSMAPRVNDRPSPAQIPPGF